MGMVIEVLLRLIASYDDANDLNRVWHPWPISPRDIYDLELLLARGVCPNISAVEQVGGSATLMQRVSEKLDLMGWALFRDQVLPALPREIQANVDEEEYLAMKIRLLESLQRCQPAYTRDSVPS